MHVRTTILAGVLLAAPALAAAQPSADSNRPAADLYKTTCQACHMADGNAALEPMNFADGKWKHGSGTKDVAKTITEGVPGTAMMPFKARLSEKEIASLASFVRAFDKALKPDAPAARSKKKTQKTQ